MDILKSNYDCLCRTCGKTIINSGILICDEVVKAKELKEKITLLLTIEINISDNLPKMICQDCVFKIETFYDFRQKSLATEEYLVQLFNELHLNNFGLDHNYCKELEKNENNVSNNTDVLIEDDPCLDETSTTEKNQSLSSESFQTDIFNPVSEELLVSTENVKKISNPSNSTSENTKVNLKNELELSLMQKEGQNGILQSIKVEYKILNEDFNMAMDSINNITKQQFDLMLESLTTETSEEQKNCIFICNICTVGLYKKYEFISHYNIHWYKCKFCNDLFRSEKYLLEHNNTCKQPIQEIGTEEGDEEYEEAPRKDSKIKSWKPKVCNECGKQYRTNYKLNEHMRKHTGEQPYKCNVCSKGFRSKIGLAQHEATHTGIYEFKCTICGKGFQCKSYLLVHQRVHSDAKPYICATCGRHFKTKQASLDHMNRHLGVKPYVCDICGRSFITKGLCKSHQRIHSGMDNRQYPCNFCNKMFVSKSYLATHIRIHTGEKPFVCEVCGKGFLTRVDLRIHSTMHTGEKSFVCEICGKAFARRDALRCHRRSHTGERPYTCDICGQSFTQFSPMAIHKRLHTGERPYKCDTCPKTFVSRSTLVSHQRKHLKDLNHKMPIK